MLKPIKPIRYCTIVPEPSYTPIPMLRIRGKWLAQAGFTIGTPVKIRVMHGCLVMTILNKEPLKTVIVAPIYNKSMIE